jgi:hypothetical protein
MPGTPCRALRGASANKRVSWLPVHGPTGDSKSKREVISLHDGDGTPTACQYSSTFLASHPDTCARARARRHVAARSTRWAAAGTAVTTCRAAACWQSCCCRYP